MENKTKNSGYTKPKISDLKKQIASLEKQLAEAKAWIAKQKGINDSLSKTIEELSDEVYSLEHDKARLERLKSDNESHIKYLERLKDEYIAETERLESYVESIYKRNLLQRIFNKRVARAITATSIKKSSE